MSHFSQVKTQITDQILLEETLRQLEYEFQTGEDLPIYGYQDNTELGQIVVDTGGRYSIGFQRQEDNTYAVCTDWWGIKRTTKIQEEEFMQDVNRVYAHLAIKKQVAEQGLIIEEEKVLENGDIELVVVEPV
ncbi:hypothetical protein TI05_11660 [Achromatium sp. WMS3]|nr:hypothetical protein TI05_11660 [Achromatium sp. WMS3]